MANRRSTPIGAVDPTAISVERERFVAAQADLERAAAELRAVLEDVEESTRVGCRYIASGAPALELPDAAGLVELRARLTHHLAAFDAARLLTRTTNMRLAVWEGASASEVARRYGVSRQYVSKLLNSER